MVHIDPSDIEPKSSLERHVAWRKLLGRDGDVKWAIKRRRSSYMQLLYS